LRESNIRRIEKRNTIRLHFFKISSFYDTMTSSDTVKHGGKIAHEDGSE
jgi:hypothetical protein